MGDEKFNQLYSRAIKLIMVLQLFSFLNEEMSTKFLHELECLVRYLLLFGKTNIHNRYLQVYIKICINIDICICKHVIVQTNIGISLYLRLCNYSCISFTVNKLTK